jgi:disulfide bond formation protein DsbB
MSRYSQKIETQPGAATVHVQAVEAAYLALQRTQRTVVGMLIACAIVGTVAFRGAQSVLGNRIYLPVIFSTSLLAFAYTVRNSMVLPALGELRRNPRDPKLLKRWSRNNLIVQGLCAAVGLTGFALQLLGAAPPIPIALYAISGAYLFLLRPVRP